VAVLAAAAAVAATVAAAPYVPRAVFVASFAAVTVAAWYGGTGAGVLAALLCVLGVDYFVIPPKYALQPTDPTELVAMAAFVAVATLIGRMTDALRAARDREADAAEALRAANRRLAEQAAELEAGNHQLQEQATELEAQQAELELTTQQLQEQQADLMAQADALQEANANLGRALADAVRARAEGAAARRAAEAAEARLQAAFAQAPAAVSVTEGPEHRFVLVNARAASAVGRDDLVGRTYAEAFPAFADQGFAALLDRVYATGEPYVARETRVRLPRPAAPADGPDEADGAADAGAGGGAADAERFYDFVYQPLTDADGRVTGILQHAVDVTEAVRARDALAASEARARLAVEAAQLGTWTWDLATDAATFDGRVRALFGFPDDAPRPRADVLASRVHPEDRARVAALLAAAADPAGDGHYDAAYRVVRPDGTERWALASGRMTFAGEGAARRPLSLFGTVRDVTAQYAAEAAARAADARFRAVQDASPDGSVLVESVREGDRPDGRIVDFAYAYVNPAAERMTGRPAAEMLGRRVLDLFPHVRDEGLFADYVRVVETGDPFVTETEYRHDGMDHGLRLTVVKVGDGFHVQFADVSERLRAERAAARARAAAERAAARTATLQRLTAALAEARAADAVAEVVVAQAVAATGAATGAFVVRPPGAAAGVIVRQTGLPAAVHERFRTLAPDAPGPAAAALRTGAPAFVPDRAALVARFPELRDVWDAMGVAAIATVPLAAAGDGGAPAVVGAMSFAFAEPRPFDAEEEAFFLALGRQAAQALERVWLLDAERAAHADAEAARAAAEAARAAAEAARAEAEAANRAKGDFLATMSHELRTPLNAIAGYAELLALGVRGPLTEPQRQDLERLRRANQHMAGLVEAVLSFARVEAGQVEYHVEAVRLAPLVAELDALVAPQLAAKGLAYDHDGCGPDTPERPHVVRADAEKVRQILLNLLTNAVKFTDAGGFIRLACEDDRAAAGGARAGARHGARHPRRPARARVRAVRAGGPAPHAGQPAGRGAGAGDQPRPGARHGRRPHRRERAGRGEHVHADAAARLTEPRRGAGGPARSAAAGRRGRAHPAGERQPGGREPARGEARDRGGAAARKCVLSRLACGNRGNSPSATHR
jgi:PAS domain S-box-containing protein